MGIEKKKKEEEMVVEAFSWEKAPCLLCSWGYVCGCKPQMRCCGKYGVKPGAIYYKGADCPHYRELPDIPKALEYRKKVK